MLIQDLGRVVTGKTPSTKNVEYWDGAVPFITPKDIQGTKHISKTERCITSRGLHAVKGSILPPRSICVSCIGNIGYVGMTNTESVSNQQINSIVVNENNDVDFVYYLMKSLWGFFKNYEGQSTALSILNKTQFSQIEVDVPDISVQREIAAALSALDDKIENNAKINHHLEQMAQAIFKSWFVENAPDDWDYVDLGVVTTEIRTKVKEQQIPVLSAVKTGNLVLSEDYFTKQVYSKDIGKYIVVEPNDFAYNPARINIGSIGINGFDSSGCVSPVYVVFRAEPEYHYFLSFFLKSPNFQEEVRVRASGSVRQSLNYGDFALIQVLYPPLDVVRKFNFQYEGILSTLRRLDEENSRLAEIRDTLLPRLMSGELSIADRSDVK